LLKPFFSPNVVTAVVTERHQRADPAQPRRIDNFAR
jgi:hypothetical protein